MNLPINKRAATPPMTAATFELAIWACVTVGGWVGGAGGRGAGEREWGVRSAR
jgi:hypothetical protein